MKRILLFFFCLIFSLVISAQEKNENKGKSKNNPSAQSKDKKSKAEKLKEEKIKQEEHDRKVWDGIGDNSCLKPSKNQPAKVRSSFQRDYPNAFNVRWTKCRGDWTATFNGGLFRSTAVYHANGDRRDTRTPIHQDNIPRRVIDEIFKRRPDNRLEGVIKIELPNAVRDIFRIKNIIEGKSTYEYYDADGIVVQYDY